MIPTRLQQYVELIATQPREQTEKKARRFRNMTRFWVGLLVIMAVGYGVDLVLERKSFVWNEAIALTLPFMMMAAMTASLRDRLLIVLYMKDKRISQT